MSLKEHAIYGGIGALGAAYLWGPVDALVFWFAAIFIDFDHYIDYVWRVRGRHWSVRNIFLLDNVIQNVCDQRSYRGKSVFISLFHTAEFFALVWFLYVWSGMEFFRMIFFGMSFHFFLDMIQTVRRKTYFCRAYFLVEYFIRRRLLRKKGINPDAFFTTIAQEAGVY